MYYKPFASRYNAPKWITNDRPARCNGCQRIIPKGERMYYFPYARTAYCDSAACGQAKEHRVQESTRAAA